MNISSLAALIMLCFSEIQFPTSNGALCNIIRDAYKEPTSKTIINVIPYCSTSLFLSKKNLITLTEMIKVKYMLHSVQFGCLPVMGLPQHAGFRQSEMLHKQGKLAQHVRRRIRSVMLLWLSVDKQMWTESVRISHWPVVSPHLSCRLLCHVEQKGFCTLSYQHYL